jgi:hypothetical protein
MKLYRQLTIYGLFIAITATLFVACKKEDSEPTDDPVITLDATKAPGHGQYRLPVLSGEELSVKANVASSAQLKSLTITKTVNLQVDSKFGTNGVLTVNPSSSNFDYVFAYKPDTMDIDQLVGFTFRAENVNGTFSESDLTLAVTLSPRDNLPRKRWNWKSVLWVNQGNSEEIKECEKDNYYLFNKDSTLALNYGSNTASGDCGFDGLTAYDSWHLTEDEKYFIIKKHGVFTPDVTQIDSFRVKTLTVDHLDLEIDVDLSVFGLSNKETFLYKMEAAPR